MKLLNFEIAMFVLSYILGDCVYSSSHSTRCWHWVVNITRVTHLASNV